MSPPEEENLYDFLRCPLTARPVSQHTLAMFSGFTVADFDCYETRKWKSNLFNRERMEVKQKLMDLARSVGGSLLDGDGAPLFIEASSEHPSLSNHKQVEAQHIFFSRNEAARRDLDRIIDRQKPMNTLLDDPTPQRNHVFLAISLSYDGFEVSLKLHPDASIDRQNMEKKLLDHYASEKLVDLFSELPIGFQMGIAHDLEEIGKSRIVPFSAEHIVSILKKLPQGGESPSMIVGTLTQKLFQLSRKLSKSEVLRGSGGEGEIQISSWIKETLLALLPVYHWIAWSRKNDYVSVRQVLEQEKVSQKQRGLGKNDRVRIVRGLWAGKSGLVQEADSKGQLRVVVGKVAVKIDASDVEKLDVL